MRSSVSLAFNPFFMETMDVARNRWPSKSNVGDERASTVVYKDVVVSEAPQENVMDTVKRFVIESSSPMRPQLKREPPELCTGSFQLLDVAWSLNRFLGSSSSSTTESAGPELPCSAAVLLKWLRDTFKSSFGMMMPKMNRKQLVWFPLVLTSHWVDASMTKHLTVSITLSCASGRENSDVFADDDGYSPVINAGWLSMTQRPSSLWKMA